MNLGLLLCALATGGLGYWIMQNHERWCWGLGWASFGRLEPITMEGFESFGYLDFTPPAWAEWAEAMRMALDLEGQR